MAAFFISPPLKLVYYQTAKPLSNRDGALFYDGMTQPSFFFFFVFMALE
jgi:hypothetical protein